MRGLVDQPTHFPGSRPMKVDLEIRDQTDNMREAMANLEAMKSSMESYHDYSSGFSGDTIQELAPFSSFCSSSSTLSSLLGTLAETLPLTQPELYTFETTKPTTVFTTTTTSSHAQEWTMGSYSHEMNELNGNLPPAGAYPSQTGYATHGGTACVQQYTATSQGDYPGMPPHCPAQDAHPQVNGEGSFSPPQHQGSPGTVPAAPRRARNKSSRSNLPYVVGDFNSFTQCRDPTAEEQEKARIKLEKAMNRKERNKEAARRSNLNKKLMRDHLEQKSVELCEQNLQLQQDIKDLKNKIHHFRCMKYMMQHVCTQHQSPKQLNTYHPNSQHQRPVYDNTKMAFFSPPTQSIAMTSY